MEVLNIGSFTSYEVRKMMDETKDKNEYLEKLGRRIDWYLDRKASLTAGQRTFLEEASWQTRRKTGGKRPRRMTNAEKKMKGDEIRRMRRGLENVLLLRELLQFTQRGYIGGAWVPEKDLVKAVPVETLTHLVRLCIRSRTFGKTYAEAIFGVLKEAYANEQEELVIIRH